MSTMQEPDPETVARNRRVHELCSELAQLFTTSLEKRRAIDRLMAQLQKVTRRALPQVEQLTDPSRHNLSRAAK